jgi:hypothetical protein
MLKKASVWIQHVSKGWVAFSALVIFLLFTAIVLPKGSSQAALETNASGSPDLSLFYSVDELYQMADAYGETGRDAYIRARFTFDLIWPLVYTLFLATAISWLYQKAFTPESLIQRVNLMPVLAGLFDYLENISTSLVMMQFPDRIPLVALLASLFTLVKWILIGSSFVLLMVGAGVGIVRYIKGSVWKAT